MKETKRKFYKKICKWKKQILCVGAGIFLGIAAWLAQGMDPVIEAGNVIQRPDIDDGPCGKRINEGAARSGQEIHHLPSVEKYGKRPEKHNYKLCFTSFN